MTRAEHLAWCKERALEYADRGDVKNAIASMTSDLSKHPETKGHSGILLGLLMVASGNINGAHEARKFIEGFN